MWKVIQKDLLALKLEEWENSLFLVKGSIQ